MNISGTNYWYKNNLLRKDKSAPDYESPWILKRTRKSVNGTRSLGIEWKFYKKVNYLIDRLSHELQKQFHKISKTRQKIQ